MMNSYNKLANHFFNLSIFILISFLLAGCSQKEEAGTSNGHDRHFSNSKNYLEQGQYRAAILEARNSLSKTPSVEVAIHLAHLYLDLGQPRSAISLLESIEDKNDNVSLALAKAYIGAQKYSSAIKALKQTSDSAKQGLDYQLYSGFATSGLGDLETANQHFDKALALDPSNEKAIMSKLIIALKMNDEIAVQATAKLLKTEHATSAESLLLLAKIEYQKSNYPEAENLLMTAIHNAKDTDVMLPVKSSVLQLLIETLTQQGRFADAVPFNKLLSESNPGWQESQEALKAIVQQIQLGNWQEAETLLEVFKEEYPGNNAAQSLLGLVSLQRGNFEAADAILENAVDPETATPMMIGASVLSKLKNNEKLEAFTILQEALTTKPDNTKLLSMYGAMALELEDKAIEGEKTLLKVIELDPGNTSVYGLLANYYFKNKQADKAKNILLQAYEFNPQVPELQYAIARSFVKENKQTDAIEFINILQKDAPKAASTWVTTALLSIQNKNYKSAKTELTKALSFDDENYSAWALLSATNLKLEDRKAALNTLENALLKFPDNRTLLIQAAQLYLNQKNNDKAEEKAAELERIGENSLANFVRADILNNKGKTEEAYQLLVEEWNARPNHRLGITIMRYAKTIDKTLTEPFLQTWEQIAPTNPQAHLAIANIHLNKGSFDQALTGFEKVLTLDENNVVALNNAAWFQNEKGNTQRALELARKVHKLAPENAAVLDTVGWILFQNNDRDSVEILKKASELDPASEEIKTHFLEARSTFKTQ